MDSAKSNDCILWTYLWQDECRPSVNDSWSYIVYNLEGDRLQKVIKEVFSAFIDKRESETLPAWSSKWMSIEFQRLLAFHSGQSQRNVAVIVYIHCFNYFGMLKGSWILSRSSGNEMSCYCPRWCGGNIAYILAHKGSHVLVYGYLWSMATSIINDARPKIFDAPWALIFKMG
jgi:hypothetical protein